MNRQTARAAFVGVNVGAVVLALWAIVRPLPLGVALAAAIVWLLVVLTGVFVPQVSMFVDTYAEGSRTRPMVALTFDDGPHPKWTREVLALLKRYDAKATFFVIGRKVEQYPDVVKEIVEQGHSLALHSYAHDRLFSLRTKARVKEDLSRAQKLVEAHAGKSVRLFRPPVGHTSPPMAAAVAEMGLRVVGWTARTLDGLPWLGAPDRRLRRMVEATRPGAVLLFHDARELDDERPSGLDVLEPVLDEAKKSGLRCVALDEWTFTA